MHGTTRQHDPAIMERTKNLLGIFVIGSLYLVTVYHLTNLYFAQQVGFVRFILIEGGIYPDLFWWGYIVLGNLLPLCLIYWPATQNQLRGSFSVGHRSAHSLFSMFSSLAGRHIPSIFSRGLPQAAVSVMAK